jgi:hypothetical protein
MRGIHSMVLYVRKKTAYAGPARLSKISLGKT